MSDTLTLLMGPVLRATLVLMVAGLVRLAVVWLRAVALLPGTPPGTVSGAVRRGLRWYLPGRAEHGTPLVHDVLSILFHAGLLTLCLFSVDHVLLLGTLFGGAAALPTLGVGVAGAVAIGTFATVAGLSLVRIVHPASRARTEPRDHLFLGVIGFCLATGFLAARPALSPLPYEDMLLLHVLAGEFLLVLVPFSRLSHFVLVPLERMYEAVVRERPATAADETRPAAVKVEEVLR